MYFLRPIQTQDDAALASIVRQVSQEYGLASESGFAVADPILDNLSDVYQAPMCQYWVVTDAQGHIFGGGGIAPLQGAPHILEIQKMYFLADIRGQGLAKKILQGAFDFAKNHGVKSIYLETTACLTEAVGLYQNLGFEYLDAPLGNTGHSAACEIWMLKQL
ncbi:GNAT family N-acetyltransferase [uncultured Acinetobacter sp.]|uniref:GNAT family N-acetyltransferase n=1 Tax=uncultured Acinetobacter sp. TaxID=165433 RepID=UPI002627B540|nr:GNAT family N-acetyltransferase [uncultured Acinetobacter sp.]